VFISASAETRDSLVSAAPKNGYVVQAAPARAYPSFDAFKRAVRALPLSFALEPVPEVRFTTLAGAALHARYGDLPEVDGAPPDRAHWPLFASPFGHSVRGSRRLEIQDGDERYVLDFNRVEIISSVRPSAPQ